jgi:hypothetical protein
MISTGSGRYLPVKSLSPLCKKGTLFPGSKKEGRGRLFEPGEENPFLPFLKKGDHGEFFSFVGDDCEMMNF